MTKLLSFLMVASAAVCLRAGGEYRPPSDWASIQTNAIIRWKSDNNAPGGVVADPASKQIRFLAEATGVSKEGTIEFIAAGPLSDRAYESLFISVASPAEIAKAMDSIGIKRGIPTDAFKARLWPYGEKPEIKIKPVGSKNAQPLNAFLKDVNETEAGAVLSKRIVWSGGTCEPNGTPVAATNIPCAVFALYNHAPSLFQLDETLDQSSTYGRFQPSQNLKPGDLYEIVVEWDGVLRVKNVEVALNSNNVADEIKKLKEISQKYDVHVKLAFNDDMTVAAAARAAQAFSMLDGNGLKMNGIADGNFYFRAFLPDQNWRKREGRIFQPFEIHVDEKGKKSFVFCEEDWSGEGANPVLKPHTAFFNDWNELPALISKTGEQGAKVTVMFVFAPEDYSVSKFSPVIKAVGERVNTFYVFGE